MTGGPVNIYEYEALAHERLPKPEYDFIAGGATDEITLKRTRAIFDAIMLRPRMLVDISQPNLSTAVLGHQVAFPILLDPAGNHGRAGPRGRSLDDEPRTGAEPERAHGHALAVSAGHGLSELAPARRHGGRPCAIAPVLRHRRIEPRGLLAPEQAPVASAKQK